jgi:hypothetical protein
LVRILIILQVDAEEGCVAIRDVRDKLYEDVDTEGVKEAESSVVAGLRGGSRGG